MEDRPDSEPKQLNNLQRNRHVRLAINVDSSEELCATHRESFENPATPQHSPTAPHGKPPALPDSAKTNDRAELIDHEHRHHTHVQRILNGPERQLLPRHDTTTDQQITKLRINIRTESRAKRVWIDLWARVIGGLVGWV